jgi:hypothetical protein
VAPVVALWATGVLLSGFCPVCTLYAAPSVNIVFLFYKISYIYYSFNLLILPAMSYHYHFDEGSRNPGLPPPSNLDSDGQRAYQEGQAHGAFFKGKGRWVAYGFLVVGLLSGLFVFGCWVQWNTVGQPTQAQLDKRSKEAYARFKQHAIDPRLTESIVRMNKAKELSQSKETKLYHWSSRSRGEARSLAVE